jgi:hypothetical protein
MKGMRHAPSDGLGHHLKACAAAVANFFIFFARNPLKRLNSKK